MDIRVNADQHLNRAVQNAPKRDSQSPKAASGDARNDSPAALISERLKAQIKNLTPTDSEKHEIKDFKSAKEQLKLTSNQIIKQARTALLAQANATTQSAMALLSG